jgi:O-antigen biosynthesis protein
MQNRHRSIPLSLRLWLKLERQYITPLSRKYRIIQILWAIVVTARKVNIGRRFRQLRTDLLRDASFANEFERSIAHLEPNKQELIEQKHRSAIRANRPLLYLVTIVQNPITIISDGMIQSVLGQTYDNWQWFIVISNDLHGDNATFISLSQHESRVKIIAPNEALPETVNYLIIVNYGDNLSSWALYAIAEAICEHPTVDVLYSDFDRLDEQGHRVDPCFKPDWSPEMMLGYNLLDRLTTIRRVWLDKLGFAFGDYTPLTWWEFCLRLSEGASDIHHIAQILCHAQNLSAEYAIYTDQYSAIISAHLQRRGLINPEVQISNVIPAHQQHPLIKWQPTKERLISIIIPTRDKADLLAVCLDGLLNKTAYNNIEVILVDTGSIQPETMALYQRYAGDPRICVLNYAEPFNFSKACNYGADHANGELLLFLNNDIEILHPDWLDLMAQWFDIEGIGVVGAKLLYPNGKIQHAGVVFGLSFLVGHLFHGKSEYTETLFGSDGWYRNLLGVTGACLLVSREAFDKVNGFDESFELLCSDIQLTLQIYRAGYRIVYTPHARLIHHEHSTHGGKFHSKDHARSLQLWHEQLKVGDPYFNGHFGPESKIPRLKRRANESNYAHMLLLAEALLTPNLMPEHTK